METLDFNIFASDFKRIIGKYSSFISIRDIESLHMFVIQSCKRVEELYSQEAFTPNLHLHMHLKECSLDYGPPHALWCFSFERCNGMLGSYHTTKEILRLSS